MMVELADRLDRRSQLPVIAQPLAYFGNSLAAHAELARAPSGIAHRQNADLVPFAALTFRAAFGMPDNTLQQRTAQDLARNGKLAHKLPARFKGPIANHL